MQPRLLVESITFSDGTKITTSDANIIALVGPNNSGKSSTLREIQDGAGLSDDVGPVLRAVTFKKQGTPAELKLWLEQNVQKIQERHNRGYVYKWLGRGCPEVDVEQRWKNTNIDSLNGILCTLIDVEKRLEVANQQEPIDFFSEAPSHPMHVLYKNADLEQKVNEAFRAAFKTDVVLNRGGGKVIAFHVGNKPELSSDEDSLSPSYFQRLCKLPFLHNQGHGMRSFVGCILHSFTSPAFIHLLDEPEAFLHPPHTKLLAGLLARSVATNRQLVIATHSGDFVRGLLDANPACLRVIRLTREGSVNRVHELDSNSIRTLWADPVLRFSNVLDAVFHEGVVLCESDSDCRFYSAILNAVLEKRGEISPDVMFAASGGKDRMPVLIQALRRLGVKIRVIADFDVLRDEGTLSAIVRALGGDWNFAEPAWRNLRTNVQSQTPPLSVNQVREKITSALDEEKNASVSEKTFEKVKQALKATSPWHYAKLAGVNALASGQPSAQLDELLHYLESCGLFVVKCGEIERFVPSVGAHGPKWVAQALAKNLAADPELETARAFITNIFDIGPHAGWCQPHPLPEVKPKVNTMDTSNPPSGLPLWSSLLKKLGF
jgi:hypothetical protein